MLHKLTWNEHELPHTKNFKGEDTMIILVKFFVLNSTAETSYKLAFKIFLYNSRLWMKNTWDVKC